MPGNWRLSVAIVDSTMLHTYDHLEEAYEFRVQPGSSVERYGLADLQGRGASTVLPDAATIPSQ